jgi:hypothetical protein
MNGLSLLLFGLRVRFVHTDTGHWKYVGWTVLSLSVLGLDERFVDTDTGGRDYLGLLIFRYQCFTNSVK